MEIKTSESYKKAVLAKYKEKRGGEMSSYLTKPTRKQIRKACRLAMYRGYPLHRESVS